MSCLHLSCLLLQLRIHFSGYSILTDLGRQELCFGKGHSQMFAETSSLTIKFCKQNYSTYGLLKGCKGGNVFLPIKKKKQKKPKKKTPKPPLLLSLSLASMLYKMWLWSSYPCLPILLDDLSESSIHTPQIQTVTGQDSLPSLALHLSKARLAFIPNSSEQVLEITSLLRITLQKTLFLLILLGYITKPRWYKL